MMYVDTLKFHNVDAHSYLSLQKELQFILFLHIYKNTQASIRRNIKEFSQ